MDLIKRYPSKIKWVILSQNEHPEAVKILESNLDKIDWEQFSRNSNSEAVKILLQNKEKINWKTICVNTDSKALEVIREKAKTQPLALSWPAFSANCKAIGILLENFKYISWIDFCLYNESPEAIKIMKANAEKIDWPSLCWNENPEAIEMLREKMESDPEAIEWSYLCENECPEAIKLLEENISAINWTDLSQNKSALPLLEKISKPDRQSISSQESRHFPKDEREAYLQVSYTIMTKST